MIVFAIVLPLIAVAIFLLLRKKKVSTSRPPSIPNVPSDWRPLLGDAIPGPIKRTPKYRIQYQANGFDIVRPKQIEKTAVWLRTQGAGHLIEQFKLAANEAANMAEWIDAAYEKNVNQYQNCGGKFASFINSHDPSTIFIEAMAIPMYDQHSGRWAGGMALRDNKTIRCVIMATGGMKDNPATIVVESPTTAHLALFKHYVSWECGNILMLRYGFVPKVIPDDEWGDKGPPC